MPSIGPFGSPLLGADLAPPTFAFGGQRTSAIPASRTARPTSRCASRDGSHRQGHGRLPEPGRRPAAGGPRSRSPATAPISSSARPPNSSPTATNGDVTIYDRNLSTGVTQVVSTTPGGADDDRQPGSRELDVSDDGSRVLIGKLVSTDRRRQPATGTSTCTSATPAASVDLTPTSPIGVLYDGMTADGSRVYFTTSDPLGSATPTRASTSTRRTSARRAPTVEPCSRPVPAPPATPTPAIPSPTRRQQLERGRRRSTDNCDVVAIAGGGGVAAGDGTVYFLSPGEARRLRRRRTSRICSSPGPARRRSSSPRSIRTTRRSSTASPTARSHSYGDFQVTPTEVRRLQPRLSPLTEFTTLGHSEIYRYDARRRRGRLRLLPADRGAPHHRHVPHAARAQPQPTTAGSSSPRPSRSCSGTPTTRQGRLRVGGRRPSS